MNSNLALSTWSLHRRLGQSYTDTPNGRIGTPTWGPGSTTLLDVPREASENGFAALEVCHFQFPSTEPAYIAQLKKAFDQAGVKFLSVLIDDGDLTHPSAEERKRSTDVIKFWIQIASDLGAERVRIIAGKQSPGENGTNMRIAAEAIKALATYASSKNVKIEIENWHELLDTPEAVLELLDLTDQAIGLKVDFGNWPTPRKYDDLPIIAPLATSTHAKAHFTDGKMDIDDFVRCCEICKSAGFSGPHALVFDTEGDEWAGICAVRDILIPYLGSSAV